MENNIKEYKRKKNYKPIIKRNIIAWLIMLPSLLLFLFFVWLPIGKNIALSFFNNYKFTEFVGFENYKEIFRDYSFLSALKNTFVYILWSIIIGYFVPIIIGFLLSECVHAKGVFRILIYLPCMISGMAVSFLYLNIYGDETYSILNVIIRLFGGEAHTFKGNPNLIIPLIVIAMTWRGAGGTALIYLSNFQTIDTSLYEASRIDGVKPIKRFLHITLPIMKTTFMTLLILQIISVFQVFYEPLVIGEWGGPSDSSMSLMLLSYKFAMKDLEYAKGAAVSVILSIIIITFTVIYFIVNNLVNKKEGE